MYLFQNVGLYFTNFNANHYHFNRAFVVLYTTHSHPLVMCLKHTHTALIVLSFSVSASQPHSLDSCLKCCLTNPVSSNNNKTTFFHRCIHAHTYTHTQTNLNQLENVIIFIFKIKSINFICFYFVSRW